MAWRDGRHSADAVPAMPRISELSGNSLFGRVCSKEKLSAKGREDRMQKVEINRGYLDYLRPVAPSASPPPTFTGSRLGQALAKVATPVVHALSLLALFMA